MGCINGDRFPGKEWLEGMGLVSFCMPAIVIPYYLYTALPIENTADEYQEL